jgi:hypothetical protein
MRFQKLWDQSKAGIPLQPIEFSVTGSNQLLLISCSVTPRKQHADAVIQVFVDAKQEGILRIHNNSADQSHHVTPVTAFIPLTNKPRAGKYVLLLQPVNLSTDGKGGDIGIGSDDYCDIVLIDAP